MAGHCTFMYDRLSDSFRLPFSGSSPRRGNKLLRCNRCLSSLLGWLRADYSRLTLRLCQLWVFFWEKIFFSNIEVTGPLSISIFTRFDRGLPLWLKAVTFLVNCSGFAFRVEIRLGCTWVKDRKNEIFLFSYPAFSHMFFSSSIEKAPNKECLLAGHR